MYSILQVIVGWVLRLLFRVEVKGDAPKDGKLLIVPNHQSFLDGIILGTFLPVEPVWLVHTTIARKAPFKYLLPVIRYKEVDTTSPLVMKQVIAMLEAGEHVCIFPEGRITVTGSQMKIYDGPAFAAAKSGAKVLPVHLEGPRFSYFSRMKGDFPKKWFPKITMTILPPEKVEMPEARTARERRRKASERLRRVMQQANFDARPRQTVFEAVLDAVNRHGRGRVMIEDVRMIPETYGHMLKASLALGRLASKHTAEGETAGVMMPNAGANLYLFLGLHCFRRIPAMLNYTAGVQGVTSACRAAQVKTIFTSRAFVEKARLEKLVEPLSKEFRILYLEDLRPQFSLADKLWLILFALRFPRAVMRPQNPSQPAVILFTSGSEGKPKGVVLSHDNLLSNIRQLFSVVDVRPSDKIMTALPMFHSFGITIGTVLPIINGTRVFFYPSPLHYRIVPEMVYDRDCTILFSTNTFLANYAKYAHPYDFYNLRLVVTGAEKLAEETRNVYQQKFGVRIFEGYGATECAPVISASVPMANYPGTLGEFMPRMEHRIRKVEGIEEGGSLVVRGPNVMLGYLRESNPGVLEKPSSPEFGEGWYDTGDIVTVDADGIVRMQGRLKRFAKVAGEMVSLELPEKIAEAASPKQLHGAVAIKDAGRGEMIVLLTQDRELKREQLVNAARAMGAAELAVPRRIVVVDKIPLLGNGKKDYVTLAAMLQELVTQ